MKNDLILDFTAIDFETTGLTPINNSIIEFGAVRYRNGIPVATFKQYASFSGNLPAIIVQITGITDQILKKQGIDPSLALSNFLNFIGNDLLVAHNMNFDWGFLEYHSLSLNVSISNKKHCTLILAKQQRLPIANHKLATLCSYYEIKVDQYHSALDDAKAAGDLFLKLQQS